MDANLYALYQRVMDARCPEDVYSSEDIVLPAGTLLEYLQRSHEGFLKDSDPQRFSNPVDVDAATEIRSRLKELFGLAKSRIEAGMYGLPRNVRRLSLNTSRSFEVGSNRYYIGSKLSQKDQRSSYQGFVERQGEILGEVRIEISESLESNYLIEREVRNIHQLHKIEVPQWKHLPYALDSFRSGGRSAIARRLIAGVSLSEIRKNSLYVQGVDQKHVVWILDRLLSCLGYVHSQGMVHCGLSTGNIFVTPESHNCTISGWQYGVVKPAVSEEKTDASDFVEPGWSLAPEVFENAELGPWTDIYSVGKLMIWLLGGDPDTDDVPEEVQWPIRDFLLKMVRKSVFSRPSDAWQLHREQNAIKDSLWERKFVPFVWS